jgi:hypothetical protein
MQMRFNRSTELFFFVATEQCGPFLRQNNAGLFVSSCNAKNESDWLDIV